MTINRFHSKQTISDGIHSPISFEYSNSIVRAAATGFAPTDINKFSLQLDDSSIWRLSSISPATWVEVTASGSSNDELAIAYAVVL